MGQFPGQLLNARPVAPDHQVVDQLPGPEQAEIAAFEGPRDAAGKTVAADQLPPSIRFRRTGGDMGRDRGRIPIASPMALPMAPRVGVTGTSPTPRSP